MTTTQEAMQRADKAMYAIESHEKVCAERYGHIRSDIADIKAWLKWALTATILGLAAMAWAFISQKWGL